MKRGRSLIVWVAAGVIGVVVLAALYPRAFPFLPRHWTISREEAVAIARERLRDLGEPVQDPYVVSLLATGEALERRLETLPGGVRAAESTGLRDEVIGWQVFIYRRSAMPTDWSAMARVSLSGDVLALRMQIPRKERTSPIDAKTARDRADAFLAAQGIDLARYGEPVLRSLQLSTRTDLAVRYLARDVLAGVLPHGVEVVFAGDRLAGFETWTEDPREEELQRSLQGLRFAGFGRLVLIYFLMILLAVPFLRRYHAGEIGVRRGAQIAALVAASALVLTLLSARAAGQAVAFGSATREQTTLMLAVASGVFQILPTCILAFFAWSVGESVCRERWGPKLAAFDALFHGEWATATVARSALRGTAAGCALAGGFTALLLALRHRGASPLLSGILAPASGSNWPGLGLAALWLAFSLPGFLTVMLCLVPMVAARLGRMAGAAAGVLLGGAILFPMAIVVPLGWGLLATLAFGVLPVALFVASDLLTALMAGAVGQTLLFAWPYLTADDATLRVNGWLALVLLGSPLLASVGALRSRREFVYRYEEIPPHVRRIAERERQRVELETARRIQSSILPELPPRLQGVEIAHAYLPASEVGGDFYDVLALADGRLAVAVGDVAGHGVSSGLVMAMAKSALAVQVTFDPEVQAVFTTLNRMVHQTARKRLLATLCYLLLDPLRRELVYASAGHLFPYRVTPGGKVHALESIAYPLGVRSSLTVEPKTAHLDPGDTLFLFSDGLVEAKADRSDEQYGFERLEESLGRYAEHGVEALRDGILADLARFTGNLPREDDQTLLVLRLP